MSIAYAPGQRIGAGEPAGWRSAVVQVTLSFRSTSDEIRGLQRGSGFILEDWPDCVLTARHIIALPRTLRSEQMSILVSAPGADGEMVRASGVACAYPSDADWDVAVVVLTGEAAQRISLCVPRPADGANFTGRVLGYLPSSSAPTSVVREVHRAGRDFLYEDGPALLGMSGGPVCSGSDVAALQSFDLSGNGRAIVLDFDVLNECHSAAQGILT